VQLANGHLADNNVNAWYDAALKLHGGYQVEYDLPTHLQSPDIINTSLHANPNYLNTCSTTASNFCTLVSGSESSANRNQCCEKEGCPPGQCQGDDPLMRDPYVHKHNGHMMHLPHSQCIL
jgi:hypothetical protein